MASVIKDVQRALLESDVNFKIVGKLGKEIREKALEVLASSEDEEGAPKVSNVPRYINKLVFDALTAILTPARKPYKMRKGRPNVVMFVGLQGAGKTTTVAKFAHYYKTRKWRVAMVCADTFRAGAFDQLRQNATKLHVPYYGSHTETDPVKIAAEGVSKLKAEGYEVIIVDTSGRHKQETALFDEMRAVNAAVKPHEVIFTMDSTIGQSAHAQAEAFQAAVDVGSVIITKLDGHAKGGGALSAVAGTGAPIIFTGSGEHFADLEPFEPDAFVGKLLGYGDPRGLVRRLRETMDEDTHKELAKRMAKGKFTLRDMYTQLTQVRVEGGMGLDRSAC